MITKILMSIWYRRFIGLWAKEFANDCLVCLNNRYQSHIHFNMGKWDVVNRECQSCFTFDLPSNFNERYLDKAKNHPDFGKKFT